ncbi:MAG: flavin reductase family protein [Eubacteriales bacterium]|nr:flavin reductase family protein [Eubacteriales bacterium]
MSNKNNLKIIGLPAPVLIIGSYDGEGNPNMMNAAYGGICSADPLCISVSIRKQRLTYKNIEFTKEFTVNIPSSKNLEAADYFGMVSGNNGNKLKICDLNIVKSTIVNAPIITDFPASLECKLVKLIEVGSHMMLIGEILGITKKGDDNVSLNEFDAVVYDLNTNTYFKIGEPAGKGFEIGKMIIEKAKTEERK